MIKEFESFFQNRKEHRIDIISGKHTAGSAAMLQELLCGKGYTCNIMTKPPIISRDIMYIIYAPQIYKKLPQHFCVYQIEQLTYDYVNTPSYLAILEKAIAVFDYSHINYEYLSDHANIRSKWYYLPFDVNRQVLKNTNYVSKKEYDVLFYGATSSERRKMFFNSIRLHYDLKVINDLFGEKLIKELKKANIIVNVHYKENAILESCRLSEVLSLGNSIIISEESVDKELDQQFAPYVQFIPVGDSAAMVEQVKWWLERKDTIVSMIERNKNQLLKTNSTFLKCAEVIF